MPLQVRGRYTRIEILAAQTADALIPSPKSTAETAGYITTKSGR